MPETYIGDDYLKTKDRLSAGDVKKNYDSVMSAAMAGVKRQAERDAQRDAAILDTAELLEAINMRLDTEREEREAADQAAKRRNRVTTTVAVLTSAATILIGAISISLQTQQQPLSMPTNTASISPTSSAGDDFEH